MYIYICICINYVCVLLVCVCNYWLRVSPFLLHCPLHEDRMHIFFACLGTANVGTEPDTSETRSGC